MRPLGSIAPRCGHRARVVSAPSRGCWPCGWLADTLEPHCRRSAITLEVVVTAPSPQRSEPWNPGSKVIGRWVRCIAPSRSAMRFVASNVAWPAAESELVVSVLLRKAPDLEGASAASTCVDSPRFSQTRCFSRSSGDSLHSLGGSALSIRQRFTYNRGPSADPG